MLDIIGILVFILGIIAKIVWDLIKDNYLRKFREYIVLKAKSRYVKSILPMPDKEFRSFRFGNFNIPAMPLLGSPETPFNFDEVTVHYRPINKEELKDYPIELKAPRSYLLGEIKKLYNSDNVGENDLSPRLDYCQQGPELEGDRRGHLDIYLSLTTFASQLATNRCLDYRVIPQEGIINKFVKNQTIREAYCSPPYGDLQNSLLGNVPGVDAVVISKNLDQDPIEQMIIRRRSNNVLFFQGWYQVSATGYMNLSHHDKDGIPNPFYTAVSESRQEIADSLELKPEDFKILGLSVDWHHLYPTFYGYFITGKSIAELLGDFRRDSYEGILYSIPFNPESVISHISKNKWTAQAALAAISTLLVFYSRDKVEKIARSFPAKEEKDFLLNNVGTV